MQIANGGGQHEDVTRGLEVAQDQLHVQGRRDDLELLDLDDDELDRDESLLEEDDDELELDELRRLLLDDDDDSDELDDDELELLLDTELELELDGGELDEDTSGPVGFSLVAQPESMPTPASAIPPDSSLRNSRRSWRWASSRAGSVLGSFAI
jgi:hypothetical protein